MTRVDFDSSLPHDVPLYRYISFESFVAFIESGCTSLSKVQSWDDTWEAILSKIPTVDEHGEVLRSSYSYLEDLFGQCWSVLPESDALWRIYSPSKTGVVISTSAERFRLIEGSDRLYLGRVVYFTDLDDLLKKSETLRHCPFPDALLKRSAFEHEQEVRLLLVTRPGKIPRAEKAATLKLDPTKFLEGVTIDPRAADWFVGAVELYCRRARLPFKPVRSTLYNPDPQSTLGLAKRWVPV